MEDQPQTAIIAEGAQAPPPADIRREVTADTSRPVGDAAVCASVELDWFTAQTEQIPFGD